MVKPAVAPSDVRPVNLTNGSETTGAGRTGHCTRGERPTHSAASGVFGESLSQGPELPRGSDQESTVKELVRPSQGAAKSEQPE